MAAPRAPGRVTIRHHVDWNASLLLALGWHSCTDLFYKPTLELLACFQGASADDEGIGIERIHHFVEEETQGVSLYAENFRAQRITLLRQTAHKFGRLVERSPMRITKLGCSTSPLTISRLRQKRDATSPYSPPRDFRGIGGQPATGGHRAARGPISAYTVFKTYTCLSEDRIRTALSSVHTVYL
jgi:hypothetical protein